MDELDMRVLSTLHKTKNITRAAEELFMTQPALTKRLQNLEQELDATLTIRSRRGVSFTPQGEFAVERIGRIQQELSALRKEMPRGDEYVGGRLSIGASMDYTWSRLPQVLEIYMTEFPHVSVETTTSHSTPLHQKLLHDEIDVAILRGDFPWKECCEELFSEQVYRICSKDKVGTTWANLPYLGRRTDQQFMSQLSDWLMEQGLKPEHFMEVDSIRTCVDMCQRGLGWSVVPEVGLSNFDGYKEPLTFRDGTPFLRHTYIAYREETAKLPQVKEFIRIVRELEGNKKIR